MTTIQEKFTQLGNSIINLVGTRASRNMDNISSIGRENVKTIVGSRSIGEIVASILPLTDSKLHLLDGSTLLAENYPDFYGMFYESKDFLKYFQPVGPVVFSDLTLYGFSGSPTQPNTGWGNNYTASHTTTVTYDFSSYRNDISTQSGRTFTTSFLEDLVGVTRFCIDFVFTMSSPQNLSVTGCSSISMTNANGTLNFSVSCRTGINSSNQNVFVATAETTDITTIKSILCPGGNTTVTFSGLTLTMAGSPADSPGRYGSTVSLVANIRPFTMFYKDGGELYYNLMSDTTRDNWADIFELSSYQYAPISNNITDFYFKLRAGLDKESTQHIIGDVYIENNKILSRSGSFQKTCPTNNFYIRYVKENNTEKLYYSADSGSSWELMSTISSTRGTVVPSTRTTLRKLFYESEPFDPYICRTENYIYRYLRPDATEIKIESTDTKITIYTSSSSVSYQTPGTYTLPNDWVWISCELLSQSVTAEVYLIEDYDCVYGEDVPILVNGFTGTLYATSSTRLQTGNTPYSNYLISYSDYTQAISTYGSCGKFALTEDNDGIILPKLCSILQPTIDTTKLGDINEAGLPQLTSNNTGSHDHGGTTGNESAHTHSYTYRGTASKKAGTSSSFNAVNGTTVGTTGAGSAHNHSITSGGGHTHTVTWSGHTTLSTVQPQTVNVLYYMVVR